MSVNTDCVGRKKLVDLPRSAGVLRFVTSFGTDGCGRGDWAKAKLL